MQEGTPPAERVAMQTAPNDIPVERLNQDFGATEPSNVSLYQPKGEYRTSLQPHVQIPPNIWGPVRNHFIIPTVQVTTEGGCE
jgi:hypothetical protein